MGMDTHALSEAALASAIEVFAAHRVDVMIQKGLRYTPTPVISHAILTYNRGRKTGLADGVVITYIVQAKPRLTDIKFHGNTKYSNGKLGKKLTSKVGEPLDERKLFTDSQEIQKMYQKAGYPGTQVKYVLSIDENAGRGTATFEITESAKIRIMDVEFVGANAFSERKLRGTIKTRRHWMFSWITSGGVFKDEQFEDDREKLAEFYRSKGYIDFEIKDVQFLNPTPRTMIIRFTLYEGTQYKIGSVKFIGNKLFSTQNIAAGLRAQHERSHSKAAIGPNGLPMDMGGTFKFGTPDEVIASLQARVDAGVEYFVLHTMTPDPAQLRDWVDRIIPNVRFPATAGPVRRMAPALR